MKGEDAYETENVYKLFYVRGNKEKNGVGATAARTLKKGIVTEARKRQDEIL